MKMCLQTIGRAMGNSISEGDTYTCLSLSLSHVKAQRLKNKTPTTDLSCKYHSLYLYLSPSSACVQVHTHTIKKIVFEL